MEMIKACKIRFILLLILASFSFLFYSCETTDSIVEDALDESLDNSIKTDIDRFYKVIVPSQDIDEECRLAEGEEPRIYYSKDLNSDFADLRSFYYYPIGCAEWNGTAKSVNDITNNAKKLCRKYGATVALYAYNYTNTRNGWTQSGSYSIDRYDCTLYLFVSYTQKYIQSPKIGIEWRELTSSERLSSKRNTGAFVYLIYYKSAAFYANLAYGDIITEINGYPIIDSASVYLATYDLKLGSEVSLKYIRDGVEKSCTFLIY